MPFVLALVGMLQNIQNVAVVDMKQDFLEGDAALYAQLRIFLFKASADSGLMQRQIDGSHLLRSACAPVRRLPID